MMIRHRRGISTSLQLLMELGGRPPDEMVLRYAHLAGEHLREAARRIEGTNLAQPETKNDLRLIASR
jgi:hypothetical protein